MNWKYMTIWDYLAWFCLAFITVWLFLKMIGIINTPICLQYAPVFSGVYVFAWGMSLLARLSSEVRDNRVDIRSMEKELRKDIHKIELDVSVLKARV